MFSCTVVGLPALAEQAFDVASGQVDFQVDRITHGGVGEAGVGKTAIALCKATAVSVAPEGAHASAAVEAGNHLVGSVAQVAAGESGDEITVALAGGGLQLVGFAPAGSGMVLQQSVVVSVDEAAVVVALPG